MKLSHSSSLFFVLFIFLFSGPVSAEGKYLKSLCTECTNVAKRERRIMACPGLDPKYKGIVIAAPHEGYDINTEPIAHTIASDSGLAFVAASFFRDLRVKRYINVNRPTGMLSKDFNRENKNKESPFPRADEVYQTYRHLLRFAASSLPAKLLIEIHGHSRRDIDNKKMQLIEVAHRGVSDFRLRLLRARYLRLCSKAGISKPVPMFFEGIDENYEYKGRKYNFRYKALNTKRIGSLNPKICDAAIHIELPSTLRFTPDKVSVYTKIFSELVKWYISSFYGD
jgi:hypothetical protein